MVAIMDRGEEWDGMEQNLRQYQVSAECPFTGDVVIANATDNGVITLSWPPGNRTLVLLSAMTQYETPSGKATDVVNYYHPLLIAACEDVAAVSCDLLVDPSRKVATSVRAAAVFAGVGDEPEGPSPLSLWAVFSEDPEGYIAEAVPQLESIR